MSHTDQTPLASAPVASNRVPPPAPGSVISLLDAAMQWAEGERTPEISDALSRERRWIEPRRVISENDGDVAGRILVEELRRVGKCWRPDQAIFRGALQLLKEAGLAPGSTELIAAAERFDLQNTQGETR